MSWFYKSDFTKCFICFKGSSEVSKSVEKPFVAIFWRLGGYFSYIDPSTRSAESFRKHHGQRMSYGNSEGVDFLVPSLVNENEFHPHLKA